MSTDVNWLAYCDSIPLTVLQQLDEDNDDDMLEAAPRPKPVRKPKKPTGEEAAPEAPVDGDTADISAIPVSTGARPWLSIYNVMHHLAYNVLIIPAYFLPSRSYLYFQEGADGESAAPAPAKRAAKRKKPAAAAAANALTEITAG